MHIDIYIEISNWQALENHLEETSRANGRTII